ncbi:MAG: hypothetical protein U5O16_03510 [Rhodococcus sp. (in: high G+C Gram-positive bacteria)]|uniref:hypothetical protein n=1 Tax=Rhodococcus sp. TaxID=1831 RepID=UPI002AD9D9E0|nr:hypothetical protein [Rhodococcus sp. (in: high G+C Gram-positive bacteria)]
MTRSDVSWQSRAMAWPLIGGAVFGGYFALLFADSSEFSSVLTAICLGSLCSLPAGALLGMAAILTGKGVLAVGERNVRAAAPMTWRLAFATATAVVVAMIVTAALSVAGADGWSITWPALTISAISFGAASAYYPAATHEDIAHPQGCE